MKHKIQVTQSSMPNFDEYIEEIKDIWDTHWLTNFGPKHQRLEKELLKYLKVDDITLYSNGHLALENVIEALDLEGEVITTPFTFASTTHAIVRNGLKPIFCDIEVQNFTIDVSKIESLITEKTSAIIPVHVYGNVCDIEAIDKLASKYNLKVVYDAAHTFGVKVKNNGIGTFGDASMFSFHATKVFNTIEGGAVTYNNPQLKKKLEALKNFGITKPDCIEYAGGNAKMNEFQAAMGLCNLKHVDYEIMRRKAIVERYTELLQGVQGIKLSVPQDNVQSNYAYFPVIFDGFKKTRDEVFLELRKHNINARKYFYPLTNSLEAYKHLYNLSETPVAEYISEKVLTLPLYSNLNLEDVNRICTIIKK